MTPGLRAARDAAIGLEKRGSAPTVLPEPWRQLIALAVRASAEGLRRQNVYNRRDQSLLALTLRLLLAGRHAGWTLARRTPMPLVEARTRWQEAAAWHHQSLIEIHAGWTRRLPAGINRALPLEANMISLEPLAARVTDLADRWLRQLARDPLDLTVDEARQGLGAIPSGVWILP